MSWRSRGRCLATRSWLTSRTVYRCRLANLPITPNSKSRDTKAGSPKRDLESWIRRAEERSFHELPGTISLCKQKPRANGRLSAPLAGSGPYYALLQDRERRKHPGSAVFARSRRLSKAQSVYTGQFSGEGHKRGR